MGIKIEWAKLVEKESKLLTILPTDTEWKEDRTKPKFGVVISDQTASVQQMNFSGCGQIINSGVEFRRRIIKKFINENLNYGATHIVLLWDKPWASARRVEMYSKKRYVVPAADKPVPPGKIRGCDNRFYNPAQAPIPIFDENTGHGVKIEDLIREEKMFPLPQLLNAAWTKTQVAVFICRSLWEFAKGLNEHVVFDTPFFAGDSLCDGQLKCNKSDCIICPGAKIPRHAESDVLFLFHIRHLIGFLLHNEVIMVRGSNDRDLLVVLSFPFDAGIVDRIFWCKGTGQYAMSPQGKWITPGKLTGKPTSCFEIVNMKLFQTMMGGKNNEMLLSRLMALFFFGGDYCETPTGLTSTGLFKALFSCELPFVKRIDETSLELSLDALHCFVQYARDGSLRCRSLLSVDTLLKSTHDAFYSLAYYTAFHAEFSSNDISEPVGPEIEKFGFSEIVTIKELFSPMLRPAIAGKKQDPNLFLKYSF